jgi:hypothetical protein
MQDVYKKMREAYKPERVDVLFIGESPPPSKPSGSPPYFYNEKEDQPGRLYRRIAYALELRESKPDGLKDFRWRNMWLTDVFDEPLREILPENLGKHLDRLFKEIDERKPPRKIVTLLPKKRLNMVLKYFLEKSLPDSKFLHLNPWRMSEEELREKLRNFVHDP